VSLLGRKRTRDIRRQAWQFASLVATVALGVLLFCASYDAFKNLYASYYGTYDRLRFADAIVTNAGSGFAEQVAGVEGVTAVQERVVANVPLRIGNRELFGRVVGLPFPEQPSVDRVDVISGEYLPANATNETLAETHLAKAFALKPGGAVEMLTSGGWKQLRLVGNVVSPEYLWPSPNNQQLFASPEDFGVLFAPGSIVTAAPEQSVERQTLVLYAAGADHSSIDAEVRRLANAAGADDVVLQADQPSNKALSLDLEGFKQLSWLFPVMFLLAAGIAAYLLLTRLVYAERDQIGTLRANGLSAGKVARHYLGYGLWVGFLGSAIGIVLGIPAGWGITGAYTSELGIPDTVRQLHPLTPLIGLAFGISAGLLAAWVPARSAVRMDPAEAMRGGVVRGRSGPSILERVVPLLCRLPVRWRMVLRGFGRNPRRSVSTVVGIVLALVLLLSSWGMLDTTEILIDRQFNHVQLEDAQVVPERGLNEAFLASIRAISGVRTVEEVIALDVAVSGPKGSYSTQLLAFADGTQMHAFDVTGGGPQPGGLVVGSALVGKTGVPVGGTLTVRSPSLNASFELPVYATVTEPLGTYVYASPATLESALGAAGLADPSQVLASGHAMAFVKFDSGVDRARTVSLIRDLPGVATVTDSRSLYNLVQRYLGLFYLFIGLMLVFGGLMAVALIFNTISVNLSERSAEFASMRANGMSRRLLARLVTAENLILTAIGIVPGLLVGTFAASRFLATFSSDLFIYTLHMKAATYVYASVAMFAVTGLSLLPGIRAVGRVDIARVVRERSQ
jgi:putative ABC transport system permease protein